METELPQQPGTMSGTAPQSQPGLAAASGAAFPLMPGPPYHDRSTALTIFGIFQIILGLLAALMIPLAALGAFMSRLVPGGATRPGQLVVAFASYASLAALFLTLGIGTVRMKRWAYALTLVISWYWMIIGALSTVLLTAALPVTMRSALEQAQRSAGGAPSNELSTGIMAVFVTVIIVVAAFFLVLVPIAFVIFYSRKDVAETCRRRDPVERWTDRAPLPVLGASVVYFAGALYMLLVGITTPLFPFFGRYLTGVAGTAGFLVLVILDIYLAFALLRLRLTGWWIAVLTAPVRMLSMILTYTKADLMQAYSKVGMSDAQVAMLNANPMFRSHVILWWSLLSLVIFFGYLLWLKRYFKTPAAPLQTNTFPLQAG